MKNPDTVEIDDEDDDDFLVNATCNIDNPDECEACQ